MLAVLDVVLLLAAGAWDIASLVLNVRRALKGSGASGVPVISWLVYVALLEWRKETFFFASAGQAGAVLTVLHLLSHFAVPWTIGLFVGNKDRASKSESKTGK